jgi:hypothetical protein
MRILKKLQRLADPDQPDPADRDEPVQRFSGKTPHEVRAELREQERQRRERQ